MTEFETKLIEVLTDIKTELQILTLEQELRESQRTFNKFVGYYKHWEDLQAVEEERMDKIGDAFFKENPDAKDFVPNDSYKRAEKRQESYSKRSDDALERLKYLQQRGCINTTGHDEL